jgi:hypothetical protein
MPYSVFRYLAAANVAFSGSERSSMYQSCSLPHSDRPAYLQLARDATNPNLTTRLGSEILLLGFTALRRW